MAQQTDKEPVKDVEMKDAASKPAEKVLTPEEKAKEALALLHAGTSGPLVRLCVDFSQSNK